MQWLSPDDDGYDAAKATWNARFLSRPDRIARPETAADVAAALAYARTHDLAVCVKGGGHDYAGNSASAGGLLIDLGRMDGVAVDREEGTVTVGPGARWASVDAATQAHELATTGGTVSHVGVPGFVLGALTLAINRRGARSGDGSVL